MDDPNAEVKELILIGYSFNVECSQLNSANAPEFWGCGHALDYYSAGVIDVEAKADSLEGCWRELIEQAKAEFLKTSNFKTWEELRSDYAQRRKAAQA